MTPTEDTLREMYARMTTQAKLLELLYTILFRDTPEAFDSMCADLLAVTRTATGKKAGTVSEEDVIEI